MVVVNIKTMY